MAPRKKRTVEENAKIVSNAFAQIVRFSLNEPFRKKCFQVLQVEGSFDLQNEINEKLIKSLQPATYCSTQSSGYDSQHPQPSLVIQTTPHNTITPSQKSQASSIVCHIEDTRRHENRSTPDEGRIASQKDLIYSLQKSPQPTFRQGTQTAFGSQNSETDISIRITRKSTDTSTQHSQSQSFIQNRELSQLSTMTQEEKDLEDAMVWGGDSDE